MRNYIIILIILPRYIILNLQRTPYTRVGVPLCYYNIPILLSRRKRLAQSKGVHYILRVYWIPTRLRRPLACGPQQTSATIMCLYTWYNGVADRGILPIVCTYFRYVLWSKISNSSPRRIP